MLSDCYHNLPSNFPPILIFFPLFSPRAHPTSMLFFVFLKPKECTHDPLCEPGFGAICWSLGSLGGQTTMGFPAEPSALSCSAGRERAAETPRARLLIVLVLFRPVSGGHSCCEMVLTITYSHTLCFCAIHCLLVHGEASLMKAESSICLWA